MKPGLQSHLHDHTYPAFLMRHPRLIGFIHAWNLLILQRNQITRQTVNQLLANLSNDSLIVDAGCGDGQHIFPYNRRFPRLRFWGIDKNDSHIAFCEKYCETMSRDSSPQFFRQNLEDLQLENEADVLLSIGILQYIENDRFVLEKFYKAMKTNGKLVLYTPVNGRMILPYALPKDGQPPEENFQAPGYPVLKRRSKPPRYRISRPALAPLWS